MLTQLPAVFPPSNLNAELKKLNEQMNIYSRPNNRTIFKNVTATRCTFPDVSSSKKTEHM